MYSSYTPLLSSPSSGFEFQFNIPSFHHSLFEWIRASLHSQRQSSSASSVFILCSVLSIISSVLSEPSASEAVIFSPSLRVQTEAIQLNKPIDCIKRTPSSSSTGSSRREAQEELLPSSPKSWVSSEFHSPFDCSSLSVRQVL